MDERRARGAAQRMMGTQMPSVTLFSPNDGGEVDMAWLSSGRGAVIYLYPGEMAGPDGQRSAATDAAQAKGFEAHYLQLLQMGRRLAGISAQEPGEQLRHIFSNAIEHMVLADPQLHLARELGLPTYDAGGSRRYLRLVLIVERGLITHAFCPFRAPARGAELVAAWLRDHQPSGHW